MVIPNEFILLQLQIKWEPSNFNTIYSVKINYRGPIVGIAQNPLILQLQEKRFIPNIVTKFQSFDMYDMFGKFWTCRLFTPANYHFGTFVLFHDIYCSIKIKYIGVEEQRF